MKILYKHRTRGQAVEAVHIKGMADGFRALGHEVQFASPPLVQVASASHSIKNRFLKFISFKSPTIVYELIALSYNLISYRNSRKLLERNSFAFIYERYAFFDFSSMFLKRNFRVPVVLEVNGAVNRKDATHGRKIVMKGIACSLEKRIFDVSDLIIVVSTSLKNSLTRIGIDSRKTIVLPNAIDIRKFNINISGDRIRKKYGLEKKTVIGFVGSFTFWHGLDFLVDRTETILKRRKDVHLLLVGDGHERQNIENQIEEKGLKSCITITGFVPHEEVPEFIAAMDIGVMPDSNNFGSPMKIFEYMAMGKPVVSAKYGPTSEVIRDGQNGFLFNPRDGKKFSRLVMRLVDNLELCATIGENARKYVFEKHTWDKNAETVIQAFRRSVGERIQQR